MDSYHIWFDLRENVEEMTFCQQLDAFLGHLRDAGTLETYRLQRRKLGFGPDELGEYHLVIDVRDLAQLDQAFGEVVPRVGETEKLHARIWSQVTNFRAGLYRDFPDPERQAADEA